MTPASNQAGRHLCAALGLIALGGCFQVDVEVVDAAHSVRLCGTSFALRVEDEAMSFQWNPARKAYLDAAAQGAVRFGHLKGDAYIVQMQPLRAQGEVPAEKIGYVLGIAHARESPLRVVAPRCEGMDGLARGYGVEVDPQKLTYEDVLPLAGSRLGIIGLLAASHDCPPPDRRFVEYALEPRTLIPGGVEMASLGARYDPERFAAPFKKACVEGKAATCAELGRRYIKGIGVPRDSVQAAAYFDRACGGGHPSGCLGLAELLERGEGRPRDFEAAVRLYRQACEKGEPFACDQVRRVSPVD